MGLLIAPPVSGRQQIESLLTDVGDQQAVVVMGEFTSLSEADLESPRAAARTRGARLVVIALSPDCAVAHDVLLERTAWFGEHGVDRTALISLSSHSHTRALVVAELATRSWVLELHGLT